MVRHHPVDEWNILISGLLQRAAVVLVDGNLLLYPDLVAQWRIAADAGVSLLGTSPTYLMLAKAGIEPASEAELSALRMRGITGSPLPDDGFDWQRHSWASTRARQPDERWDGRVLRIRGRQPLAAGVPGRARGAVPRSGRHGIRPAGQRVVGQVGELVIRTPMPSMPARFWSDPDDERYRASYFDVSPGVWRHGDWVTMSERRSFVISGRSDATLNRGVRLGTAEFYAVVEELPEVADSLVVHVEDEQGGPGRLLLFVVTAEDVLLGQRLRDRIRGALRRELSPRHVPDAIEAVPAVPHTSTGKKLERPINQILLGRPLTEVISSDAVTDFAAFGELRSTPGSWT